MHIISAQHMLAHVLRSLAQHSPFGRLIVALLPRKYGKAVAEQSHRALDVAAGRNAFLQTDSCRNRTCGHPRSLFLPGFSAAHSSVLSSHHGPGGSKSTFISETKLWRGFHLEVQSLRLHVNISPRQLLSLGLGVQAGRAWETRGCEICPSESLFQTVTMRGKKEPERMGGRQTSCKCHFVTKPSFVSLCSNNFASGSRMPGWMRRVAFTSCPKGSLVFPGKTEEGRESTGSCPGLLISTEL